MKRYLLLIFPVVFFYGAFGQTAITPAGPTGYCPGGSVVLTITGAAAGSTYQWQKNGGNVPGATGVTLTVGSVGTYNAIVTTGGTPTTLNDVVVDAFTAPVADFTFNNNNACSGTQIQFTSSVSSGNGPYTYAWDFGDGSPVDATQNPAHTFTSLGCGTGTFNVKLTVTDVNGCKGSIVTKPVSVKQAPDIDMKDHINPFNQFNNCTHSPSIASPGFTVGLSFNTASPSCATTYSIDWGDGNSQSSLTAANFPLTHPYNQLGTFDIVVSVLGTNGCSYSKTYKVVNQSNPAVGILAPGSTTGCAPIGFWFKLKGYELNSPGTTYTWDFGDGSSLVTWTTPVNVDSIFHVFNATSCTKSGGQFVVKVTATNGCKSTTATVDNITVYIKPVAGFSSPLTACMNTGVTFTNTTVGGYNQGSCDRTTLYSWNFGDPTSSQNTSSSTTGSHAYSAPGIYTVTLVAEGSCGRDTVTKQICITGPPTSSFTLDKAEGCAPQTVTATNTSVPGSSCVQPSYKWTITYSATNCGTGSAGNYFVSGTKDTSANPVFSFTNPGTYTINLAVTNACGTVNSNKTVVVKSPPKVTFSTIPNACSSVTFNPKTYATVTNCGSNTPTYLWTFNNGTPSTSTLDDPGPVAFNTPGANTVTLAVTNECGTTTTSQTFTIAPPPDLTVPANITVCAGQLAGPFAFTSTTTGTTFSWTNNNINIGLGATGSTATIPAFTAVNTTASPITATVTVNATKGGCPATQSFTITVNPRPAKPAVVRPIVYCLNETAQPLSGTATSGNSLNWYAVYPLANGSTIAPTPSTSAAGNTTYYVTQSNSYPCESDTAKIIVTVNPKLASNTIAADQTICNGSSASALAGQGTVSGGAGTGSYLYQWQQSADGGVTWTNIGGATLATYNPTAVTTDTKYRRVVVSASCSDTSNVVSITVQGSLTNAGIGSDQTICRNTQPDTLRGQLPIGGSGTFTYQWESSPTGTGPWTLIGTATGADYLPPVLSTTIYYRRKVSSGQCSVYSAVVKITVNPKPVMTVPADQYFCNNSASTVIAFASSPAATSYAWVNDNTAIGVAPNGTGNIASFTTANNSSPKVPVTATIKVVPTFTADGVGCAGDTATFTITVLPTITITPKFPDTTVCTGQTIGVYVPAVDTGFVANANIAYGWTVTGSGISLTNGSGVQVPAYTTSNAGTTDLTATVAVTPKYTYKGRTCDGALMSYVVTVKPSTANANAGIDQLLCAQTSTILSAVAVTNTTGTWSQVGTGAGITSPSSNITTVTGLAPGTLYKFVWTQTGFASCPATKDTVVIDNKPPLVNKIDTATQTICAGATVVIPGPNATGGGGTFGYQWESSTNGINFTTLAGATSPGLTVSPTATTWYRRVVTATPCSGPSDTVKIIVQPALTNNGIGTTQTICTGLTPLPLNGSSPAGGNGAYTYTWEQSTNGGSTWTPVGGATAIGYSPGALTQTTQYRRVVSTALCSGQFGSTSNVVTITVNPDAKALFVPTDTVKCPPFVITPTVVNLQPSAANSRYIWYANGVQIGTGTTFPGYTIANENDSVVIKLKVISTYGCKDDSLSQKFKTVRKPTPSFTLTDTVGCGPITVSFINTSTYINSYNYFWNFGNGQTSTVIQPGTITFAPNPAYGDTTYVVRLKVFSPCDTLTFAKSIRVKSKPKALFTPTKTTGCSPMTVKFRNTSKGSNTTYYWDFGDGATLSTVSPDTVQHTFITGVVDTFYVKLKAVNECGADSLTYSIIVAPNTIRLNLAVNGTEHFGCAPHAVSFINNSQGASVFLWNFGDGANTTTTKNVDTVRHAYLTPGTYTVTMQAVNNCSDTTTTETIVVYPKPRAQFTANTFNVCIGDPVQFVNGSDSATAYLWTFGDGGTSTLNNPSHAYTTAGSYVVTLISYRNNPSGNVCTDSTKQTVTVAATQTGFFSVSDSVSNCAPFTVTMVNRNKPSVSALWDFGDGAAASGDSVVHTFQTAGTYLVKLTVKVPGGCTYVSTKTINASGPKGSLLYNSGYVCHPSAVQLQAVATGATSYDWNFGDGTTLNTTQQTVYHTYAAAGYYLPKVTLNNGSCGVLLKGLDTIKVDKVDGGFRWAQTQVCGATTLTFTDTSHLFFGTQNTRWAFGDNTTGGGGNPSHSYAAGGRYTVQMIVLGKSGCADTVSTSIDVTVKSKPAAAINATDTACTRRSIGFAAIVQTVDPVNFIQWNVSNGASGTGTRFDYTFTTAGTYTVRLVVGTTAGCYDTAYHTVRINPSPVVTATPSLDLCKNNQVQLNAIGAATWQWLPLSGLSCYTCFNPVASPTITTPYVVEGKNSFGCADWDTVVITVIQPLKMTVSPDDSVCTGGSVNLLASGASSYNWSPSVGLNNTTLSNPTASPTVTTRYRVVGYDGYNCFTDTAYVTVAIGQYPTVNLGPDLTLPAGTLHPLATTVTNGPIGNWNWTPTANLSCSNCALPVAEIKKDIAYAVRVTTPYGCSASDTVNIKVVCAEDQVYVPNAFSPDGDGLNDVFMIRGRGIARVTYFRVFNRWGEMVFEAANFKPNDLKYGWDGKVKGKAGGPDVFVYTWEAVCENGAVFSGKGNVSLIK